MYKRKRFYQYIAYFGRKSTKKFHNLPEKRGRTRPSRKGMKNDMTAYGLDMLKAALLTAQRYELLAILESADNLDEAIAVLKQRMKA